MTVSVTGPYPLDNLLSGLPAGIHAAIESASRPGACLAEKHNAYVDHCLALLFAATGHRPVRDPFVSIRLFDLRNGLLLVSDKVASDDRAWRLIALPDVARNQVREYLKYLPHLASRLAVTSSRQAWLPAAIHDLPNENRANLPLFFYLDENSQSWQSVSPSLVERRWQAFWPFSLGMLRHVTACELWRETARTDWVEIQLGHISGVDHPFGATAVESAIDQLRAIAGALDTVLRRHGWRSRASPLRATSAVKAKACSLITPHLETLHQHAAIDLAYVGRANERERRRQAAAPVVRELIATLIPDPSMTLSASDAEQAISMVVLKAREHRLSPNHCFRLMYRFLRRMPNGANVLRRIRATRFVEAEPSPFYEDSLTNYSRLCDARLAFTAYLERSQSPVSPVADEDSRVAEILLSAVVFGGLAHQKWITRLLQALPNRIYQFEGEMFVDLPLDSESREPPVYRWFPDPVTSALILGWRRGKSVPATAPPLKQPAGSLRRLLRDLDLAETPNLATIVRMARSSLWIEQPGFLANILALGVNNVSLPLRQWMRITTGNRLKVGASTNVASRLPSLTANSLGSVTPAKAVKQGEGAQLLATVRECLKDAQPVDPRGNVRQNAKRRQLFSLALKLRFGVADEWSSLALSLGAWGVNLCEKGTRTKRHLAFSTVQKYLMAVAKGLYGAGIPDSDFLSLDAYAYEQVYLSVLEEQPPNRARYLFGRLQEYHDFLVDTRAVDDPDWSVLAASATIPVPTKFPDANVLTEAEYLRTLACIRGNSAMPRRLAARYGLLVLLGFRFALRFGEALRVEVRNIQATPNFNQMFLEISSNVHGDTKTAAATRVIPLIAKLHATEIDFLQETLPSAFAQLVKDPLHPLMSTESAGRVLIDRSTAAQHIHDVLRAVTGDPRIRYHHLRHSWASQAALRFLRPISGDGEEFQGCEALLGLDSVAYPLRAIASAIGHARECTTIASYIHTIGELVAKRPIEVPTLSDRAMAYCLRISNDNVRKRRSRYGNAFLRLRDVSLLISEPSIPFDESPFVCPSSSPSGDVEDLPVSQVDWLLRAFGTGHLSTTAIASQLSCKTSFVEAVVQIAAMLERRSGYSGYRIIPNADDPTLGLMSHKGTLPHNYSDAETTRVEILASELLGAADRKDLWSETEAWIRTYRWHDARNYPTDVDELLDLRTLYLRLDAGLGIEAILDPANMTAEAVKRTLEAHGVGVREGRIALALERHRARRQGRLCLFVACLPPRIRTIKTLHRTLFLVSVMVRIADL